MRPARWRDLERELGWSPDTLHRKLSDLVDVYEKLVKLEPEDLAYPGYVLWDEPLTEKEQREFSRRVLRPMAAEYSAIVKLYWREVLGKEFPEPGPKADLNSLPQAKGIPVGKPGETHGDVMAWARERGLRVVLTEEGAVHRVEAVEVLLDVDDAD